MFFYFNGEQVKQGDYILWSSKKGVVELVLEPNSKEAEDYGVPDGGVMFLVDWEGGDKNRILEPFKTLNEDIEFIRRSDEET